MSRAHRFPVCPTAGKVRLGERKDVQLALRESRRARGAAAVHGTQTTRREVRGYRCEHCRGWHLTSSPQR